MNINIEENKQLKEVKAILEDNEKNFDSIKKRLKERNQEKKDSEENIRELDIQINKGNKLSQEKQREISLNKLKIKELEDQIATNEFNYKVKELLGEQPSFWDVLSERIELHQKELDTGLEGLSKPPSSESVCKTFKAMIDGRGFDQATVAVRGVYTEYHNFIKELCECVVRGQKISITQKKRKIDILDRFLMSNQIIRLWGE